MKKQSVIQKLVTKVLYWLPVICYEGWEGAEVDTESIRHQPLVVLHVLQNPVHEVWGGIYCSYKQTSWQWLLTVDMSDSWSCNKQQAWEYWRPLGFPKLPLALSLHLYLLKSPFDHLKSQPGESWEVCGWNTLPSLPCPVPIPAWIRAPFGILPCILVLTQCVLSVCCLILVPDWVQATSPLPQAMSPDSKLASPLGFLVLVP